MKSAWHRGCLCWALLIAACTPFIPKPVAFTASEIFLQDQRKVYGVLEVDPAGDGFSRFVTAHKEGEGFRPVVYVQRFDTDERRLRWQRGCAGPVLTGSEVDAFKWVTMGRGSLLWMRTSDSTPDTLVQQILLLDPTQACAVRFKEGVSLERLAYEAIVPHGLRAGAFVVDGQQGVRIMDQPKRLRLRGRRGDVELLLGMRERWLRGSAKAIQVEERWRSMLEIRRVTAQWTRTPIETEKGQSLELPELIDGKDNTSFSIRGEEQGALRLQADEPVTVLEIHHGCHGRVSDSLTFLFEGGSYVVGEDVPEGGMLRAVGRSLGKSGTGRRELLALSQPTRALRLEVERAKAPRCLRQVKAYGVASWTVQAFPGPG